MAGLWAPLGYSGQSRIFLGHTLNSRDVQLRAPWVITPPPLPPHRHTDMYTHAHRHTHTEFFIFVTPQHNAVIYKIHD